jgi:hypothetical protein
MYTVTMDIDGLTLGEYKAVATALGPEARSAAEAFFFTSRLKQTPDIELSKSGTPKTGSRCLWRNTSDP